MESMASILVQIAQMLLVVFFLFLWSSIIYTYKIDDGGIHIKTRFNIWEIKYLRFNLIKEISIVPSWKVLPLIFIPFLAFGSTFGQNEWVIVKNKTGIIRWSILTPKNPRQFIETIRERLTHQAVINYPPA
jgi:hypothetical protein